MERARRERDEWSHGRANVGELTLHYVEAGERGNPLVILLHGFPEFWYSWRRQLDPLAEAGFHVIAPDLRGYNHSDRPTGVESYRLDRLVADVVGLIDHADAERASVVGHDWGGVIAWEFGHRYPERLDRLVVLNAPHLDALEREFLTSSQFARSWYAAFFQLPKLPEFVLGGGGYGWVGSMLRRGAVDPEAFDEGDIQRYETAIARPGALGAALDYYRAFARTEVPGRLGDRFGFDVRGKRTTRNETIDVPTLVLWGERDRALDGRLTTGLDRWVPDIRVERLPDASHWVQNDAPDRVNDRLVAFLTAEDEPTTEAP